MKSLYKIHNLKKLLIISAVGIILLTTFVGLIGKRPYDLTSYLILFCGLPTNLGILLGILIIRSATMFHTPVNNPVKLEELVKGQTYWLNGEFKAIYWDTDKYTGRLLFEIEGLKEPVFMFPGQVTTYISANPEPNSKEAQK